MLYGMYIRRFEPWVGKIPWRRAGNPLQCSCLVNPHGQRSLVCCSPWGLKELDTTERRSPPQWVCKGVHKKYNRLTNLNKRKLCYQTEFSVDDYKESRGSSSH